MVRFIIFMLMPMTSGSRDHPVCCFWQARSFISSSSLTYTHTHAHTFLCLEFRIGLLFNTNNSNNNNKKQNLICRPFYTSHLLCYRQPLTRRPSRGSANCHWAAAFHPAPPTPNIIRPIGPAGSEGSPSLVPNGKSKRVKSANE